MNPVRYGLRWHQNLFQVIAFSAKYSQCCCQTRAVVDLIDQILFSFSDLNISHFSLHLDSPCNDLGCPCSDMLKTQHLGLASGYGPTCLLCLPVCLPVHFASCQIRRRKENVKPAHCSLVFNTLLGHLKFVSDEARLQMK